MGILDMVSIPNVDWIRQRVVPHATRRSTQGYLYLS